jgi:hypothetical protein
MSPVTESEGSTPQISKHSSWHNYSVYSIKTRIFLQAVSSGIGAGAPNFKAEVAVMCACSELLRTWGRGWEQSHWSRLSKLVHFLLLITSQLFLIYLSLKSSKIRFNTIPGDSLCRTRDSGYENRSSRGCFYASLAFLLFLHELSVLDAAKFWHFGRSGFRSACGTDEELCELWPS